MVVAAMEIEVDPSVGPSNDTNDLLRLYTQLKQLNVSGVPKIKRSEKNWLRTLGDIEPYSFNPDLEECSKVLQLYQVDKLPLERIAEDLKLPIDEALDLILDNVFLSRQVDFQSLLLSYAIDIDLFRTVRSFLSCATFTLLSFVQQFGVSIDVCKILVAFLQQSKHLPEEAITAAFATSDLMPSLDLKLSDEEISRILDEEMAKALTELDPEHTELRQRMSQTESAVDEVNRVFDDVENVLATLQQQVDQCKADELYSIQGNCCSLTPKSTSGFSQPNHSIAEAAEMDSDEDITVLNSKPPEKPVELLAVNICTNSVLQRNGIRALPMLKVGDVCFACFVDTNRNWFPADVVNLQYQPAAPTALGAAACLNGQQLLDRVCVRFSGHPGGDGPAAGSSRWLDAKLIALSTPIPYILRVGTRVVALQEDDCRQLDNVWHAGVIAEEPSVCNGQRYLIFFDDGFIQYARVTTTKPIVKSNLREVCQEIVTDDEKHRKFVRDYLAKYPEKVVVRMHVGQLLRAESNDVWWDVKVLETSASVAKIEFLVKPNGPNAAKGKLPHALQEWIYRGSLRLAPLYLQKKTVESAIQRPKMFAKSAFRRRPETVVFETVDDAGDEASEQESLPAVVAEPTNSASAVAKKAQTAKKSTAQRPAITAQIQRHNKEPLINCSEKMDQKVDKRFHRRRRIVFAPHDECTNLCLKLNNAIDDPKVMRRNRWVNPLLLPLLCGWERQKLKMKDRSSRRVTYVSPCGRRLRSMPELAQYLLKLDSKLSVEFFCFDATADLFNFSQAGNPLEQGDDYSRDREPLVKVRSYETNTLGLGPVYLRGIKLHQRPPLIDYCPSRFSSNKLDLNDKGDFVSCCDCKDDCLDKSKCACQKLTAKYLSLLGPGYLLNKNPGYEHRRLKQACVTGVFECNKNCACSHRCVNKVVQNSLQVRLEIFKTKDKGWGVRSIDDLPKGAFVAIYAGQILTPGESNQMGIVRGDEYHAGLDYIEVVEELIEECEIGAIAGYANANEAGDDSSVQDVAGPAAASRLLSRKESAASADSESNAVTLPLGTESGDEKTERWINAHEQQMSDDANEATASLDPKIKQTVSEELRFQGERKSLRVYLNEQDGDSYIIDGKSHGNVGRYFNHSCSPNMFVQSVFADTHDPRFPWVGFFTSEKVRAGTELCWDYNYIVDSVPGKKIYCRCGTTGCRKRML